MLALVVLELVPEALRGGWPRTLVGSAAGAAGMFALSVALGV
jgi:hypothetical protein